MSGKLPAGTALALILAASPMFGARAAWCQMRDPDAGSIISTQDSTDNMDQQLAYDISRAWAENEDASGAVALQNNGETALSQGDKHQARIDFEAAEKELAHLKPNIVAPHSSVAH